ncbi:enoyl-[acyl-carrier-protein] reductase [NADH] 1, chloroplastic-like isoform X2 [Musa acuminata AAA Group]
MGASPVAGLQVVAAWPCISSPQRTFVSRATASKFNLKVASQGLTKLSNISLQGLPERYPSSSSKYHRIVPRAMTGESEEGTAYGLPIDLRGKRAFIAGGADDNGYGWAIAKALAAAGAEILVGTWVPDLNIFETSLRRGKFDNSCR